MARPLTKTEQYLFTLTDSRATTIPAQRAAIARAGLTGLTPAKLEAVRRRNWRAYRKQVKTGRLGGLSGVNPAVAELPVWYLAAVYYALHQERPLERLPKGIAQGKVANCRDIAQLVHDRYPWGRLVKHGWGYATADHYGMVETDNGKTGFRRVVNRCVDYVCVVSPDNRHVVINIGRGPVVKSLLNGRFLLDGTRYSLRPLSGVPFTAITHRAQAERLRRNGLDARVVWQTQAMVSAGSGETIDYRDRDQHPGLKQYVVVPDGNGGWYHCDSYYNQDSAACVRLDLARRVEARRLEREEQQLLGQLERIWVRFEDSLAAGNCRAGTEAFLERLQLHLGASGPIGAVRADVLLKLRNDAFVKRAIRSASLANRV